MSTNKGLLGAMAALILIQLLVSVTVLMPLPAPYKRVNVVYVGRVDGNVVVVANFYKNEHCEFQQLEASTETAEGRWVYYDWTDIAIDNRPTNATTDRLAGHQTLAIKIIDVPTDIKTIELRTRHLCSRAERVYKSDKIFAVLTADQLKE